MLMIITMHKQDIIQQYVQQQYEYDLVFVLHA